MTLIEYVRSLQDQGLPQREIFDKVQEFKKNNPQEENVEEVKENVEVKKDGSVEEDIKVEEKVSDSSNEPSTSKEYTPEFEDAEGALSLLNKKTGFGTETFASNVFNNIRKKEAEKAQKELEKYTAVAKPGETYVRPDSSGDKTEYKYENKDGKGIYYYREPGSTEWKTHKKGSEAELAIAAVFKHSDADIENLNKRKRNRESYDKDFSSFDFSNIDMSQSEQERRLDSLVEGINPLGNDLSEDGTILSKRSIQKSKEELKRDWEVAQGNWLMGEGVDPGTLEEYSKNNSGIGYQKIIGIEEFDTGILPPTVDDMIDQAVYIGGFHRNEASNFRNYLGEITEFEDISDEWYAQDYRDEAGYGGIIAPAAFELNIAYDFDSLPEGIDAINFLGMMANNGLGNQYVKDINDIGDFLDGRANKYSGGEEGEIARQRHLWNNLSSYALEEEEKYQDQVLLNWLNKNRDKVKGVDNIVQAKEIAKKYFREEYGQDYFPTFDRKELQKYKEQQFPELVERDNLLRLEAQEKKRQRIEENGLGGLLNTAGESIENAYDTVAGKLRDMAYLGGDLLDLPQMNQLKIRANELDKLDQANDLNYMYVSGKQATVDGTTYYQDESGTIYNSETGMIETVLDEAEYKKINTALEESDEYGSDYNFRGSVTEFSGLAAGLIFDVGMIYATGGGAGIITKAPMLGRLAGLANSLKLPPSVFNTAMYYGGTTYASTKRNVYQQFTESGMTDEDADGLATDAARLSSIWAAATSFALPTSAYMKSAEKIFTNRGIFSKALKSYKKGGPGAYRTSLFNSFKNIMPTRQGGINLIKGSVGETVQENTQGAGEEEIINRIINKKASDIGGSKFSGVLDQDYTFNDAWRNTLLSLAAGGVTADMQTGFGGNPDKQLQNLFYVGNNLSDFKAFTNRAIVDGELSQADADAVVFQAKAVVNQSNKIPPTVDSKIGIESAVVMQQIADLETKMKNTDPAFQGPIEKEIADKKLELNDLAAAGIQEGSEVIAEQLEGVGIESFDTTNDFAGAIETLKEQGGKVNQKNSTNYGVIVDIKGEDGEITQQILINKEAAANNNVATTAQHELLHAVLDKTFRSNPAAAIEMGTALDNLLNTSEIKLDPRFKSRQAQYKKAFEDGKISEAVYFEEILTLTSEGLSNGTVKETPGLITKLKQFASKLSNLFSSGKSPINIEFKTGKDVLNFLKGFNESVRKGEGLTDQQLKVATEGATGDLISNTEANAEADLEVLDEVVITAKSSKEGADVGINDLATGITKVDWDAGVADNAIADLFANDTLKGLIESKIPSNPPPGFNADDFVQGVFTELIPHIRNFNPEANDSLSGWINSQLRNKIGNVYKKGEAGTKAEFETDVTEAQGVTADAPTIELDEVVVTAKRKSPKGDAIYGAVLQENLGSDVAPAIETAIESDLKSFPVVNMAGTRNIGPALGNVLGKAFGLNPEIFTIKSRNIAKKDLSGLTNLRQYLTNNAQSDFSNLPDAYDSKGKSTFIPNSILEALYVKDGKGKWKLNQGITLTDYKNLIGDIDIKKPIYRSKDATIAKALAGLSFRNKMFETAFPKAELRVGTGVKFSLDEEIEPSGKKPTIKKQQETIVEDFGAKPIKKDREGVSRVSEFITGGMVKAFGDATSLFLRPSTWAAAGNNIASALKRDFLVINDASKASKNKQDSIDGVKNGDVLELKEIKETVNQNTNSKNLDKDTKTDINNVIGSQKGAAKAKKNQGQQKSILNGKNFILNGIRKIVLNNKFDIAGLQFMLGNQNANAGLARNMATINNDGRTDKKGKAYEEHWFPMGAWVTNTLKASGLSDVVWNGWKKFSNDNYYQEIVNKDLQRDYLDKTYDVKMEDGSTVRWNSKSDLHPLLQDAINYGLETGDFSLANKLADIRKYPGKDVHTAVNPFTHGRNGVSDAVRYGIIVGKDLQSNPNIQHATSSLINEIIIGKIDSKTAQERIDAYETTAKDEEKSAKVNSGTFGDKVNSKSSIEEQIDDLKNYDKAAEIGRDLNAPTKGISVFDFDDTLAKTKEKVIVNTADGKTKEISAAEFAKEASTLEAAGATFDFSNFEGVADGTLKGPLADLALKRQDKFGSKDIFVLTARPQASAEAIKTFLDGIGLNLPIENITGLADGTPGAKGRWIASKAAEGYNDFYFADDSLPNVEAVSEVLSQIDVKSDVQIAKSSLPEQFDKIFNDIIESSTGIESFKEYSKAKAQTVGKGKGKFSFFTTPSAEDFLGLLYKTLGKGKVGEAQLEFYKTNLLEPYDRAELATTRAKVQAAADFKKLKSNLKSLPKSLSKEMGYGGFTHSQAARVAVWTRQGMNIPGLSKTDLKALNKFVDNNAEMNTLVDELMKIQKGKEYPAPGENWLAGTITTDVLNGITKVNRKEYLQQWQQNVDIIFSDKNMNKLEAAYGPKYVEALRDQLRRMKSGSNRPIGGSRVVNNVLDWLNNSVGAIMFLNTRSAVLQTLSSVNFIGVGNNSLINSAKAFANQKQYWTDFKTLMNSPYLVERRNGLKINVSESEIADAVAESEDKPKSALNYLLSKGFVLTRFADSFAIATGGAGFYRNQLDMYVKQGMPQDLAQKKAFEDFYSIAEKNQQSSNPSKISQQQASGAGRVILAFANTPMQYARIIKRSSQDLINGRGDWKKNVGTIAFYGVAQNVIFNAMQNALFADAFGEDEEEEENNKTGRIANGMADSLLAGLGIQGKAALALKNSLITLAQENDKKSPKFVKAVYDLFDFSPPLDSKFRKLRSAANTFTWDRKLMKEKGFSLDNPAYLAGAQVISGLTNVPLDRAISKINNIRGIMSERSQNWQKVALALGWSTWDVGLGYYGGFDKPEPLTEEQQYDLDVSNMRKETSTKQQKQMLLDLGLTRQELKKLKYEEDRVKKIIELQKKKKDE